jgi:hypothetical protein
MKGYALSVDGEFLDVNSLNIRYSIAAVDVVNFDSATGNATPEFDIVLTAKNSRLLGYVTALNVDLTRIRKRISAELYLGTTIVDKGFIQVNKLRPFDKTASIQFFAGSSDWITLLDSRKLAEADWSKFTHLYTGANVRASQNKRTGYIYPVLNIDNQVSTFSSFEVNPLNVKAFYPCLYASSIMKQICADAGYILQGTILDSSFYKRLCFYPGTNPALSEEYREARQSKPYTDTVVFNAGTFAAKTLPLKATASNGDAAAVGLLFDDANNRWVADGAYIVRIEGQIQVQKPNLASYSWFVNVYKNGVDIGLIASGVFPNGQTGFALSTVPAYEFSVVAGDVITLVYALDLTPSLANYTVTNNPISYISLTLKEDFVTGATVDFKGFMPDVKQSEFFKAILAVCNAVAIPDTVSKTITLVPFKNEFGSKDYSSKVDVSRDQVIDYNRLINSLFQRSVFSYEANATETVYESGLTYGSGIKNLEFDLLDLQGEVVEVPFAGAVQNLAFTGVAATGTRLMSLTYGSPVLFLVEPDVPVQDVVLSTAYSSFNIAGTTVSRLAYGWFYKPTYSQNINAIQDQMAFDHPIASQPQGLSLFERFYPDRFRLLDSGIYAEIYMQLSEVDVLNFAPNEMVYIDLFRSYCRINKIVEYNPANKVTLVELIILQ